MEIKETLFTKSFSVETESPYIMSIEFMEKLSESYRVFEKKNIYETDGPVKRGTLVFDVVESIDGLSQVRINFSMMGENNVLYVDIVGYFVLKITDDGFFKEAFTEFYLGSIFPTMRKISEKHIKELEAEIDRL